MSAVDDSLWPYYANRGAAILFITLFGATFSGHVAQAIMGRTAYMIPIILATALQILGYASRYLSIVNTKLDTTQIVSQVVIIIGPAFLAAEAYMVVGRMMSFVGPNSTFISHMIITKIFVCVDIASLVTQSIGSAMLFQDDPSPNITILQTGRNVLIAGFVLQLGAFAIFTIIAILFHRKAWEIKGDKMTPLEPLFRVFYTAAVLVILQSILSHE